MSRETSLAPGVTTRLALFDLDNTLLTGDSDVLWVEFLLARGILDASFAAANTDMDRRYRAGLATAQEFCALYVSTLTHMTREASKALREAFHTEIIQPRIPAAARALVESHRAAGDTLVMTTATNRFITELTAIEFAIDHLIATEIEEDGGVFTGKTAGVLNMREGKVERLRQWLAARDLPETLIGGATFYSDSVNDLPLLSAVNNPLVVDGDAALVNEAKTRGWRLLSLDRSISNL